MYLVRHSAIVTITLLTFSLNYGFESPFTSPEEPIRPTVIIFDPDYTLWPFCVADLKTPLYKKNKNVILDKTYKHLKIFRQIPSLLGELQKSGHKLALISQSPNTTVYELLEFFGLKKFFTYLEVYPGNKTDHMEAIHIKEDLWYGEMLYLVTKFEDIEPMADLGMACILVGEGGITMHDINKGLHIFSTESPEISYSEDTHESSYLFKE